MRAFSAEEPSPNSAVADTRGPAEQADADKRGAKETGLVLDGIAHAYDGVVAIRNLNLSVGSGEIVCLLGPSGCGKSTALRLAAGLEQLQVGEIRIGGQVVARGGTGLQRPPEQRGVGLMFQDYALFPHMSVQDNVAFGLGKVDRAARARVLAALDEVGLEHLAERYPHTLSGGQQQRIALLRALMPQPGVVLLDEPFSGLDQHMRQRLRRESLEVLRRAKVATLMVTHDPEEAMYLADRIVVLNEGRVVQDASPPVLYEAPADPFVARLFGVVNEHLGVVSDGAIDTPIGRVRTPDIADGHNALAIVRATELSIDASPDGGIDGVVVNARPLGGVSEVVISIDGTDWLARVPGVGELTPGQAVRVSVRPESFHVFAV
jgi:iron(III) transport system ATP-binding protein